MHPFYLPMQRFKDVDAALQRILYNKQRYEVARRTVEDVACLTLNTGLLEIASTYVRIGCAQAVKHGVAKDVTKFNKLAERILIHIFGVSEVRLMDKSSPAFACLRQISMYMHDYDSIKRFLLSSLSNGSGINSRRVLVNTGMLITNITDDVEGMKLFISHFDG